MRNATKIGLIGCGLLLVTGLGWYFQHRDAAHDWLRTLGRKHRETDEVVVEQRQSANLPGLAGVKIRVADIKRGQTADVEIIGPHATLLASKKRVQVGERIGFAHEDKEYQLEVVEYHDGAGDWAKFRLIPVQDERPD